MRLLGNLEPGGRRSVTWSVHPSRVRGLGQLDWTVTLTATGLPVQAVGGVTSLTNEMRLDAAGPVLRDADDVVVLGDSYSSGEGGGSYTDGACHRSEHAWGRRAFAESVQVHNLACSGAVVADYWASDQQDWWNLFDDVTSQRSRLEALVDSGDADVVLLTMGGNDVQFADLIVACTTKIDCQDDKGCNGQGTCHDTWKAHITWLLSGLGPQLRMFYEDVARLSETDVVVLPYPDLLPNTARGQLTCTQGLPLFNVDELRFARWVQDELHRQIDAAVDAVARKGLPVHLARDVRSAVQPNHTICDREPWVVQVSSGLVDRGKQELVHPTRDGYGAMAGALLRWSTSTDAPKAPSREDADGSWLVVAAARGLGQLLAPPARQVGVGGSGGALQGSAGTSMQVTSGGHLQGSLVVVGVHSTPQALGSGRAGADGRVIVDVRLPEGLSSGEHTMWTAGSDRDGECVYRSRTLEVGSSRWWPTALLAAAGLLLALVGWPLLRLDRRRARRRTAPPA